MDAKSKLDKYLHDPSYREAFELVRETFKKESESFIVGASTNNRNQIKFNYESMIALDEEDEEEISNNNKKIKKKYNKDKEKKKTNKKKKIA